MANSQTEPAGDPGRLFRRRELIAGSLLAAAGLATRGAAAPAPQMPSPQPPQAMPPQPASPPQLKPELVKEYVAKSHTDLEVVRTLSVQEPMLVRASWDWGNGDWETGLGAASHMGRRDIARFLLDNGARIDAFAICMLGELALAKALLAAFPSIHKTPGPHGIPLLAHAIVGKKEAFDVLQLLVDAGADVNGASPRGGTILMQAVMADQPDMVRVLLDRGANPAAKTADGLTALDLAKKKSSPAIIALLTKG